MNADDLGGIPWELVIGVSGGGDRPLPSLAAFGRLATEGDQLQVRRLNVWIEPQSTCNEVLHHHGVKGLQQVLMGIARASVELDVAMEPRVRSVAEFLELA